MADDFHGGAVDLLGSSLNTLRAYAELRNLAEDLRILSFNAELAANRIGGRGRTMRVLTQETRDLAYQLRLLDADFLQVKERIYRSSAAALKAMGRQKMLEAAVTARPNAADAARRGSERQLTAALASLDDVVGTVGRLSRAAGKVQAVAEKANAIMIAIAVEATGSGGVMEQFQAIATAMRSHASALGGMNAEAHRQVTQTVAIGAQIRSQAVKTCTDPKQGIAA